MALLELRDVKKDYWLGSVVVPAVKGVSFSIRAGDFVSVTGPSGSGKSTVLNLIGLIDTPTAGCIQLNGQVINDLADREMTRLRHEVIGFIFQSFNLIPVLTVRENVEFPLLLGRKPAKEWMQKEFVDYLIHEVGLDRFSHHRPNELSGGQRQRVAIARALVTNPLLVLADEPTANLDSATGDAILDLMRRIHEERGTTFVFSTHDPRITAQVDHVIQLRDGLVVLDEHRAGVV